MVEEIWKLIKNSGHYEISNKGRMRNKTNLHILKPSIDKYGYYKIKYNNDKGVLIYKTIHRLVAEAFIPNPENKPCINHKDGIKTNNNLENLEWVTVKENIIHSFNNLLNKNTSPVELLNIEDNSRLNFRSIKDLGRYLSIFSSSLIPLIKNSNNNPIYGKYVVIIKNEELMLETSNTENFGKEVYVYDEISEKLEIYPSILLASYFTGIRSLHNIKINNGYFYIIGYHVAFDKDRIPKNNNVNKEKILNERLCYLNKPYRKHSIIKYYLYDYYKKKELVFENLDEITNYLINIKPKHILLNKSKISSIINGGVKRNKSALVIGFGIKSSLQNYPWFPYNEEIIINSKYNRIIFSMVYEVKIENRKIIIFGMKDLCEYFNYRTDKLLKNITLDEIIESTNIPNLSVRRLNAPIL